ncbi:hypothetical protein BGX23_000325 [Mortierella sp. AD031]|nr:hypothetical protein BGX23_000325 [Mortierella sp. AD031]KAG0213784.1 hypothetical protein BGX33_002660 [Mortierella sp. NVP41]
MADVIEEGRLTGYGMERHSERWYELYVWLILDDLALYDDLVEVVRDEATSPASSTRRNSASRESGDRKRMGHRVNGLFFAGRQGIEIGGYEIGPDEEDRDGAKYLYDGLKLQKILKVQLDRILEERPPVAKEQMGAIGLQMLGRKVQMVSMDWVAGKFMRFRREESTLTSVIMKDWNLWLMALAQVSVTFDLLRSNIKKLDAPVETTFEDKLYQPFQTPPREPQPPPTATTPTKKKDMINKQ